MNLIRIESINNCNVVDSRLVANELDIQHESFIKTIRKYETQLQAFGQLRFEMGTVTNSVGAVNTTVFVYLNEEQATFVMTLSRNTQKVVQCKMKLVKAFSEAKKLLVKPKTALELAKEQVKLLEYIELVEAEKKKAEKQLQGATETIDVYRSILNDQVALTFKQIADALMIPKMGRNNLIKFLRNISFLVKRGAAVPRHDHIEAERAIVFTSSYEIHGEAKASQSTRVTFKGLVWILNKLREANYKVKVTAKEIWNKYNTEELTEELKQEVLRETLSIR